MPYFRKSFNFRDGVQVDSDNFVVNPNGLVGIGTTIPRELLDVKGSAVIDESVITNEVISTLVESEETNTNLINVGILSVTSGIVTSSSVTGVVTYYGDGGKLINLPTSQWIDVDPGFGYTSIYAAGNVGVGTDFPNFSFQVGGDPNFSLGLGINSEGGVYSSGIITAAFFQGDGFLIENINADNISSGTISTNRLPIIPNDKLPSDIDVSGIITSRSIFSGNLVGNVNSSGISTFSGGILGDVTGNLTGDVLGNVTGDVTGNVTGNLSGNVFSPGISTFNGGIQGNLTGNVLGNLTGNVLGDIFSTGISTFFGGLQADVTGNLTGDVLGNVTGNVTGNLIGDVNSTGISTFLGGIQGDLFGDVVGGIVGDVTGNLTGNVLGDVTGDVTGNLTGNVLGDVTGDVTGNLTGDVTGNLTGDVTGNLTGDVVGNVTGDVTGNLTGNVLGDVTGNLTGNVTGNVTGNLVGDVNSTGISTFSGDLQGNLTGNVNGDVTGNVTGNLTGNVVGNVTGNLTGNVNSSGISTFSGGILGDVTGNLTGDVLGNVTGDVTGNLTGDVLGNVTGNLTGDVLGNVTGDVTGDVTGNVFGDVTGDLTGNLTGNVTGNVTGNLIGDVLGNLTGIADTAINLVPNAVISISKITSQISETGISTITNRINVLGNIGVNTDSPNSDIHVVSDDIGRVQVTSENESYIIVGKDLDSSQDSGGIRYVNLLESTIFEDPENPGQFFETNDYPYSKENSLDVFASGEGNLNYYLNLNKLNLGLGNTGNFNWIYGPDSDSPLMTLTYDGNLGIGKTQPISKLDVNGSVNINQNLNIGQNLNISQNIAAVGAASSVSVNTLYVYGGKSGILNPDGTEMFPEDGGGTVGVSTFVNINVLNQAIINDKIAIGNTQPLELLHIGGDYLVDPENALVANASGIGIGTTSIRFGLGIDAEDSDVIFGTVGIGTTNTDTLQVRLYVNGPSIFRGQVNVSGICTFNNDILVGSNNDRGVILTSPNGTQYRLIVADDGSLSTTAV